jgi:NAD(P)-dependent dehydrogenase (short-subunit alcohol dehydrogenase family)
MMLKDKVAVIYGAGGAIGGAAARAYASDPNPRVEQRMLSTAL